jgi:hypothetical protein
LFFNRRRLFASSNYEWLLASERVVTAASAVRSTPAPVQTAECWRQRMTIWAKQSEIVEAVILPHAINMLNLNRRFSGFCMALRPTTALASLTLSQDQIPFQELGISSTPNLIAPVFQLHHTCLELIIVLAS